MVNKLLLLLLFTNSFQVQAEIYKWVDAQGNISYSDQKPEDQASQEVIIKDEFNFNSQENTTIDKITKFEPLVRNSEPYKSKPSARSKKLIMYSASWCGYCKKARNYFNQKRIRFTEYDIEKNATAKRKYDQLGGRGVPLIVSGNNKMSGFSIAQFERFYNN